MKRSPIRAIRTLRPGEVPPTGEPRRYHNALGYVRLRWPDGIGRYVECYEHRFVMGMPPESMDVHHRNRVRDDNRPENLEVLTSEEHAERHAGEWVPQAIDLYNAGRSTHDIAKLLALDPSVVYRTLARRGVRFRTQKEWKRLGIDQDEIERLARDEGLGRMEIATLMDIGDGMVRSVLKDRGVPTLGRSNRKGDDAKLSRARRAVRERSGGMCEVRVPDICTGRGQHVHHRLMRSQGGAHDVGNLLDCCLACHEHVHANPAESYERGWLLHRNRKGAA